MSQYIGNRHFDNSLLSFLLKGRTSMTVTMWFAGSPHCTSHATDVESGRMMCIGQWNMSRCNTCIIRVKALRSLVSFHNSWFFSAAIKMIHPLFSLDPQTWKLLGQSFSILCTTADKQHEETDVFDLKSNWDVSLTAMQLTNTLNEYKAPVILPSILFDCG